MRAAAVFAWIAGFGFGLPGAYGLGYFAERGHVWMFLGLPTYGQGPFEDVGLDTTTTLLAAFLLVCAAEVIAGVLLWQRRLHAIAFAAALLPVEFAFWIGFGLPAGPILGLSRTAVAATARVTAGARDSHRAR